MDVYEKLKELGLTLPEAPAKGGVYTPCKLTEDGYAYISGCGPVIGGVQITGKLGQDVSVEDGQKYAQNCMLNVLAVLERKIGDLNRVADVVKILVLSQARMISTPSRRSPMAQAICLCLFSARMSVHRRALRSV